MTQSWFDRFPLALPRQIHDGSDGTIISSEQSDLDQIFTKMFNGAVKFFALAEVQRATAREYSAGYRGP